MAPQWQPETRTDVLDFYAAWRKDTGLDPATLAWVLEPISLEPSRLLLLRTVSETELAAFRHALVARRHTGR